MSSQVNQADIDINAVNGSGGGGNGIRHGAELVAFTEAVMTNDADAIARERRLLRNLLSDEEFVDVAAVIGAFNVVTRIADATGIPLDPLIRDLSSEVRRELDLARFASSANTPST